jgi:hypothetical protein
MASKNCGLSIPVLHQPRLEELQAQRSYLLSNLQQENFKATDLLRKLPALEETLTRSQSSTVRRRSRKQIGWLRYRINETTLQERAIMNRLGQLGQEIWSREMWNQIESGRKRYESTPSSPVVVGYDMQRMCISPVTPPFHLQEYPFPYVPTTQQKHEAGDFHWGQSFHSHVSEMPSEICTPINPKTTHCPDSTPGSDTQIIATASSISLTRGQRSSSMSSVDVKLSTTKIPQTPSSKMKRYSTGCSDIIKICSNEEEEPQDCRDETLEGSQYSGYYLNR